MSGRGLGCSPTHRADLHVRSFARPKLTQLPLTQPVRLSSISGISWSLSNPSAAYLLQTIAIGRARNPCTARSQMQRLNRSAVTTGKSQHLLIERCCMAGL